MPKVLEVSWSNYTAYADAVEAVLKDPLLDITYTQREDGSQLMHAISRALMEELRLRAQAGGFSERQIDMEVEDTAEHLRRAANAAMRKYLGFEWPCELVIERIAAPIRLDEACCERLPIVLAAYTDYYVLMLPGEIDLGDSYEEEYAAITRQLAEVA